MGEFSLKSIISNWRKILRPLPLIPLILGLVITVWITRVVQDGEKEAFKKQSSQRATDLVDRTALLVSNSILRVQSYDELFELSGINVQYRIPTLERALANTIFKRLTIFRLEKLGDAKNPLPELQRMHLIEATPSILPINPNKQMRSENLRQAVAKIIKDQLVHQTTIYSFNNVTILSVVWRATSSKKTFFVFSTPLIDLFEGMTLNPQETLIVTDPLTKAEWAITHEKGKPVVTLSPERAKTAITLVDTTSSAEDLEASNKIPIQFVTHIPRNMLSLYKITFVLGLLITSLLTYVFSILISQNRRIAKLVVEKTYDLENANHDLHEALAARSRFLANVSHEVRTPLNLILGMIDLSRELAVDDRQRNYLNSMNTAGNHLLGMVEDILDLSRPEFHSVDIKYTSIQLLPFLEEICRIIGPICLENNLKFYFMISPDLPMRIRSDPSRLRQILLNLLRNSTKYTPSGFLILRVTKIPTNNKNIDQIRFEVQDSGVGIPKDRLGQIFEAFFQIENSKNLSAGGVGLGLSIVKDLVRKLNGNISVSSTEKVGTTFNVDLNFETLSVSTWTHNFEGDNSQKRRLFVLSTDAQFMESVQFLSVYPQIELIKIQSDKVEHFASVADSGYVTEAILDATTPPSPQVIQFLDRVNAHKVIIVGDRRKSARPIGKASVVQLETNPLFPVQILRALGFESKGQVRTKRETVIEATENTPTPQPDKNFSILIADDDIGNRELFAAYLQDTPCTMSFAKDGQEALDMCARGRPDILIADLRMPFVDGFTLIETLRAEEKAKDLTPMKILLITADALDETAEKAKNSAADIYLTKPIRKAQLLEALKTLT